MRKAMAAKNDLPVGRIAGLFGIRGELKCDPTSSGRALFCNGAQFRCEGPRAPVSVVLASVREHKGRLLLRLEGVETADGAEDFVGSTLFAHREEITLGDNEYLDRDLVGCVVVDLAGERLGVVQNVEHFPTSDMLVVDGHLVPMIRQFIVAVDLGARRISVTLPPGLLDGEED